MALPAGARALDEAALPAITLPAVPGATLAVRRGWEGEGGVALVAVCARAPSDRWAPGVEELVLDRAAGIARGALAGEVERFDTGAITAEGPRFAQGFTGAVRRGEALFAVRGEHLLGFAGAAREAALCTVICTEPAEGRCAGLIAGITAEGAWTGAPPPSLGIRAILATAEHPEAALAIAGALGVGVIAAVLARRPRPQW